MQHGMKQSGGKTKKVALAMCALLLVLFTSWVFAYSVKVRRPSFGALTMGHEFLTGSTVLMTKHWYREGAWNLRFLQLWNPRSIEFPTLQDRQPYYSVPCGTLLPIYALSKVLGREPTPELVMGFNLATHGATALVLCLLIFVFLTGHGVSVLGAFLLALIPPSLELLHPGTMYWRQNIYYSDQAIVLPYVLLVFLEMLHDLSAKPALRRTVFWLESVVLFYGAFTDWFMLLAALAVYLKRLVRGQVAWRPWAFIGQSFAFWLPVGLAVGLFCVQLAYAGMLRPLLERALMYSGSSDMNQVTLAQFNAAFWQGHVRMFYGAAGIALLRGTVIVFAACAMLMLIQRVRRKTLNEALVQALSLAGLIIVPSFVYVYALRAYAAAHSFSADKMTTVLATATFVLLPCLPLLAVTSARRPHAEAWWRWLRAALSFGWVAGLLCGAGWYLQEVAREQPHDWGGAYPPLRLRGDFLAAHTGYADMVFSPNFKIPFRFPQQTCYSMKLVYEAPRLIDMYSKVQAWAADKEYIVNVFLPDAETNIDQRIRELLARAYETNTAEELRLYKIRKRDFLQFVETHEKTNVAYVASIRAAFGSADGEPRKYLADMYTLRGAHLLSGRFGLFGRGADHFGELMAVWGLKCDKGLELMPLCRDAGTITCPLKGRFQRFRSVVAVNDTQGAAIFRVLLDGKQIFSSGERFAADPPLLVDVHVNGGQMLELVSDASTWPGCISTVWCNPYLTE